MSMNKAVCLWMISLFCMIADVVQAQAGDILICEGYGYTANMGGYETIQPKPHHSQFSFNDGMAKLANENYVQLDAADMGFARNSVVFYRKEDNKLLYLYEGKEGLEVGVSRINQDSDSILEDMAIYSNCHFTPKKEMRNGVTTATLDFEKGATKASQTTLRF